MQAAKRLLTAFFFPCLLGVLVAAAFRPVLKAGITSLDDATCLVRNPDVRGWSRDHLKALGFALDFGFKSGGDRPEVWRAGVFQPVSWLTHMGDFSLYGERWAGHHRTSVLFHAANAALAYVLVLLLLEAGAPGVEHWRARAAAAFGAAAWALQPLRVQPVGWLSTRSYLVPTFFILLSAIAYLKAQTKSSRGWPRSAWLAWSWLAFMLSLLSKSFGLTLPAVFLILDAWPLGRLKAGKGGVRSSAWLLAEKLPFFAAGLLLFKISLQGRQGVSQGLGLAHMLGSMVSAPRLCQAVFETTYFVEKSLLPFRILSIYELHEPWHPFDAFFGMRTLAFLAITLAALAARRKWPQGLACWAAYLVTLAPLSGLVLYDMANQISQDKYGYPASLWLGALAGFAALALLRRARRAGRWAAPAALGLAVAGLTGAAFRQAGLWADQDRWWEYNVALNPDCYLCRIVLGINRGQEGRFDEAIELQIDAARRWPDYASREYAVAQTIEQSVNASPEPARSAELAKLNAAFGEEPAYPGLHYHLAQLDDAMGRLPQAVHQMSLAARYDPANGDPRFQLGVLYDKQGRRDLALAEMKKASRVGAGDSRLHLNLGLFYGARGMIDAAISETRLSAKLDPGLYAAHFNLGVYYAGQGRYGEAAQEARLASALDANSTQAHLNLGVYLTQLGRLRQARSEFQAALRLDPGSAAAKANLASVESRLSQRAAR